MTRHLATLSAEQWLADIDFICEKVERQFSTFSPNLSLNFLSEAELLKKNIQDWSLPKTLLGISRLMAKLKDAHSQVNLLFDGIAVFDKVPLYFYHFEEGLYIISGSPEYKDIIGAKVLKIGQYEIKDLWPIVGEVLSADNEIELLANGALIFQIPDLLFELGIIKNRNYLDLEVELSDGYLKRCKIPSLSSESIKNGPLWIHARPSSNQSALKRIGNQNYFYQFFEKEDILYCFLGSNKDEKGQFSLKKFFKKMFKKLDEHKPEKLLIDLRSNSGGDYTKSKPLIQGLQKRPFINQKGKLFIATSRHSYSAAIITAAFLRKQTEATLIGEPGRSNPNQTDDAHFFVLPNSKLTLGLTIKVHKHLPELQDLDYLPVDILIRPDFRSYQKWKDLIFDYVRKF